MKFNGKEKVVRSLQLGLIILLNGLRTSRNRPILESQRIAIVKGQDVLKLLQKSEHWRGGVDE